MRQLKQLSLLLGLLLLGPSAYAQSVRFQSQAISTRGAGIANATVAVCTQPANTNTQPCSPLATLATSTITTSGGANPLTADSFGNFFFYAAPGRYTVQIYGPAVSGQFVTPDVEVGTNLLATNLGGVLYVGGGITSWVGSDIGAQINSAYAALPSTGGTIKVIPQSTCYSYSTPIVFATAGKFALLTSEGAGSALGNACLLYTPTTATSAITMDFAQANSASWQPAAGLSNLSIVNGTGTCFTDGGCGSSATALTIGNTNTGLLLGQITNAEFSGFGTDVAITAVLSFNVKIYGTTFTYSGTGVTTNGQEGVFIDKSYFAHLGTGISGTSPRLLINNTHFDGNTGRSIHTTGTPGAPVCTIEGSHFENVTPTYTAFFVDGTCNYIILGGDFLDDQSTGDNASGFIQASGVFLHIVGTQMLSGGRTANSGAIQILSPTRGFVQIINQTASVLTVPCGGANASVATCWPIGNQGTPQLTAWSSEQNIKGGTLGIGTVPFTPDTTAAIDLRVPSASFNGLRMDDTTSGNSYYLGPGAGTSSFGLRDRVNAKNMFIALASSPFPLQLPQGVLDLTEVAAPAGLASNDRCYGDSTAHAVKCSYNNGTFFLQTQTIGSGTTTTNGTGINTLTSQSQPTITITGALATDTATCSLNAAMPATWQTGIQMLPPVVTANTVTVWLSNPTATATITPAAAVVRCTVTR